VKADAMNVSQLWKLVFGSSRKKVRRTGRRASFDCCAAAEVLECRTLLSSTAPGIAMSVASNNITLTSTDINNPSITISQSGNTYIVSGANGTQITYLNRTASVQSVVLSYLNILTVNLGTGTDTVTIAGISTRNNIVINGQSSGVANIAISASNFNTYIAGSIQANLGGESGTFSLFGSYNGGGSTTVVGSVNITESSNGTKQVNIYGPPANNPTGGTVYIKGSVTVLDTGNGQSGLHIDDGVTIGGNLSYNNSANIVNGDSVQIYSNSNAYGLTSIAGSLTLALSQAPYQSNSMVIEGFGRSLAVTGAVNITSGPGTDNIELANVWFKSTARISTGSNPTGSPDLVSVDGSRFDGATTISMSGPYAKLALGTDATFGSTNFNSTFAASLTGISDVLFMSNATASFNEVVFLSTVTLTGGTVPAVLIVQGNYFYYPAKMTRVNFTTTQSKSIAPNVTVTVQGNNLTLASTDIFNANITVTRSGGNVVITGNNGTTITYNAKTLSAQSVAIAAVGNLTVNLGAGNDTVAVYGLSTTGDVTITGQAVGNANVSIYAGPANVVVGGSVYANLAGEAGTFSLYGSSGAGSMTVNGSVVVTESSAGSKQVNIYGPPSGSPAGGQVTIKGGISVTDKGNGSSGLRIDDGVKIGGNVTYNNAANTVGSDTIQIYSNSNAFGVTSIAGALSLSLSQSAYQINNVTVQGYGSALVVTGAVNIVGGAATDKIELANDWFKGAVTINSGSNPTIASDVVSIDGSRFDSAAVITMTGPYSQLDLGTNSAFATTSFNSTFAASLSGASSLVLISNASATSVAEVAFYSTAAFTGGTPAATMVFQGRYFAYAGKLTKKNFAQ
jgi:hypothetical protein